MQAVIRVKVPRKCKGSTAEDCDCAYHDRIVLSTRDVGASNQQVVR